MDNNEDSQGRQQRSVTGSSQIEIDRLECLLALQQTTNLNQHNSNQHVNPNKTQ